MLLIQTALKWGWSPSALIREAKNPRKHHPCDYALAIAYELIESEKCGSCGTPAHWAYSEDTAITFTLEPITCYACAHKEEHEKDEAKEPGTRYVVKAVPEDGFTLPGREDFVADLKRKAERKAEEEAAQTE